MRCVFFPACVRNFHLGLTWYVMSSVRYMHYAFGKTIFRYAVNYPCASFQERQCVISFCSESRYDAPGLEALFY